MDFSKASESNARNAGRDHVGLGLILLVVGAVSLAGIALVAHLFGSMWDVLLLRDIVSATTALPVYLLILAAVGLILKGVYTKLFSRRAKASGSDSA